MTSQSQMSNTIVLNNHTELLEHDSSSDGEEYTVPLIDHQPGDVQSGKASKTTGEDRVNEKFVKSLAAMMIKIGHRMTDLQQDLDFLQTSIGKHLSAKPKKIIKAGSKEPERFCIDKLSPAFVQIHFNNRLPDSETDVGEVTSVLRNVYFDKKHVLIDDVRALEIVTPEELSIHHLAILENRPLFQIKDTVIPNILKRIQRLEPMVIVKNIGNVGVPVSVNLPEIVKLERSGIEMAFHHLKLANVSSNLCMIAPSLMREIRAAFPLSKIPPKPSILLKALYDLGHITIYQEVKNPTLVPLIGVETINVDGHIFVTDEAILARKKQVSQIEIEGKICKINSAVERLFAEPIESSEEPMLIQQLA